LTIVGTSAEKHERQRQNRQAAQALSGGDRSRTPWMVGIVAVLLVAIGAVVLLTRGDDGDEVSGDAPEVPDTTLLADEPGDPAVEPPDAVELPTPPEGIELTEATPCPPAEGTERRVQRFAGAPPTCIDPAAFDYAATFVTTEGTFTAVLDAEAAPVTVNNFVVLARYRFYDGVPFHRIVPDFVLQAGDGDGEPWGNNDLGYTIPDELPSGDDPYPDHSLAMANAGPDTNGSQFFVVLPGGGGRLGPLYSRFGQVVEGRDVVDAIGLLGSPTEEPTRVVLIERLEISEMPKGG